MMGSGKNNVLVSDMTVPCQGATVHRAFVSEVMPVKISKSKSDVKINILKVFFLMVTRQYV